MAKQVHMKRPADWIELGTSGAAAAQTVSHAAVTDSQHFLCGLSVSFSATGSALASIEMDDVVIWSLQIYDKEVVTGVEARVSGIVFRAECRGMYGHDDFTRPAFGRSVFE